MILGSAKHKVQLERHQAVNRTIERFILADKHSSWRSETVLDRHNRGRPWLSHYHMDTPAYDSDSQSGALPFFGERRRLAAQQDCDHVLWKDLDLSGT